MLLCFYISFNITLRLKAGRIIMMDTLIGSQAVILSLDVDAYLFEKLNTIVSKRLSVVEINTVDTQLLKKIVQTFPQLKVGAGNIMNAQQIEDCHRSGVDFITSPGFLPELVQTANIYSINYLAGIATPSEAMQAMSFGFKHVRPYPLNYEFCVLLNNRFPLLRLYPAEVNLGDVHKYLNLPSVAGVSILNPNDEVLEELSDSIVA